jgi:plastocyanin
MSRRLFLPAAGLSALAALTITVAACGGSSGSSSTPPTIPAGALEVDAVAGLRFDSEEYTAAAGSVTIAYVNEDSQRHTLVIKDADGIIIGDKMEVTKKNDIDIQTVELAAGEYEIYCDVPGHGTMKAILTVE